MKRTIIQQGAGYTVTLPVEWVKKYGIKKGDSLEVSVHEKSLVIEHDKEAQVEAVKLKLTKNRNQIINSIVSAYRTGAEEVHVHFDKNDISDRHGALHKTSRIVQETVNSLTGFSIVDQKNGYFLIKDIAKARSENFDAVLRRAFILLLNISEESMKGVQDKDRNSIEEIPLLYESIRQLVNYALRLLNKHESLYRKTTHLYSVVNHINDIADSFRHLAKHYSHPSIKMTKELAKLHKDLHDSLRAMYEAFYKFDEDKIERYFEMRDKLYLDYRKFKGLKQADGILENIGYIRAMSTNIVRERMGM